jgi:hypothetical protein
MLPKPLNIMFHIVTKMVTIKNKKYKASRMIVAKLRSGNDKIRSKDEIITVIRDYEKIYNVKINLVSMWVYLRKASYIKRILGDYYYIYSLEERHNNYCNLSEEELVFLVLGKMGLKWYLGLESALKANKISWQALNVTAIVNNHFSGIKKLGNSKFKFIKTKEKRFCSGILKGETRNKVVYFYSGLEKTALDFLYFSRGKDTKNLIKNLGFEARKDKLKKYAKNYPRKIQEAV